MKHFNRALAFSIALLAAPSISLGQNQSQVKSQIEDMLNQIDQDLQQANQLNGLEIVEHIAISTNVMRTIAKKISYISSIMDKKYPELQSFTSVVSSIDSNIGRYRSQREAADSVGTPDLKQAEQRAKKSLESFLIQKNFIGANYTGISDLKAMLNRANWAPGDEDRDFILNGIAQNLEDIYSTNFDMHQLQGYGGLHSYRALTRSITHQISGVSSFFDTNAEVCSINNEGDPEVIEGTACGISSCVYSQIANTRDVLGNIKDLGETYENMNPPKHLSDEELRPAVEIYAFNTQNKVLEAAARQIRNCTK